MIGSTKCPVWSFKLEIFGLWGSLLELLCLGCSAEGFPTGALGCALLGRLISSGGSATGEDEPSTTTSR
jgi:hypothetical protein